MRTEIIESRGWSSRGLAWDTVRPLVGSMRRRERETERERDRDRERMCVLGAVGGKLQGQGFRV
jgi:hypothetical protein